MDKAFISCRSLSMENGITDISEDVAAIHHLITQRSNYTYLILDSSKVGPTSFAFTCDIAAIDAVICDQPLPEFWQDYLKKQDIMVF